jgi:hypothetical protein
MRGKTEEGREIGNDVAQHKNHVCSREKSTDVDPLSNLD